MRHIDKTNRLKRWDDYVLKAKPTDWNKSSSSERLHLHKHLHQQQNGLCVYCEQKIPPVKADTPTAFHPSHLEHMLPKGNPDYAHKTFEQNNLGMSCMGFKAQKYTMNADGRVVKAKGIEPKFCAHRKLDTLNIDLFINPLEDAATADYFIFEEDLIQMRIKPSLKDNDKAQYTIDLLQLNYNELAAWRLELYQTLLEDETLNIDEYLADFPPFYTMIKYLWGV
jgi:uncharacterized protein (TIGR02646 family)